MGFLFNQNIFKAYDIRGKLESELTQEVMFNLGLKIGLHLTKTYTQKAVSVGMDARSSSLALKNGLIQGLQESGLNVFDIGIVPTPVCYYSCEFLDICASFMITGSHNPSNYNGLKITTKGGSLSGFDIKEIAMKEVELESKGNGKLWLKTIDEHYIKAIFNQLNLPKKPLKIGIDAMNGSGGKILKEICNLLSCDFVFRNMEMTGDFENRLPEPSKPANIDDLQNFLEKENLDFVFAFDGDADRVLLLEKEKVWYGDDIILLLSYFILKENAGRKVIFDVKSSIVLETEIAKMGGRPVIFKTGHSLIKQKMKEENAILAGEMSGHIYINDGKFFPFDDGIYCFLRIVEILLLNEKLPQFPFTFKTSEIKIKTNKKQELINKIEEGLTKFNPEFVLKIDGIKAYFDDKKTAFLARSSNTEDVVILRAESHFREKFELLLKFIESIS